MAPVHTMHHCNAQEPHKIKDSEKFAKVLVAMAKNGGEMMPEPQASGMITSNLLKLTGLGGMTVTKTADSDLTHLNQNGLETFFG